MWTLFYLARLALHPFTLGMGSNGRAAIVQDERLTGDLQMLVLSRKKDEKIVIGENITLMVIEIRGDKVRLGIDAPRDVAVHREEVYDAIKRESEQKQAD
jgi:carbon storage regulator